MRLLTLGLALLAAHAEPIDVFLATDRLLPAAATLSSVCSNAADVALLRFHLVVPDADGGLEGAHDSPATVLPDAVRTACGAANFSVWTLSDVEREIASVLGVAGMVYTAGFMTLRRAQGASRAAVAADGGESERARLRRRRG